MTPAARVAAAIELLDEIIAAVRADGAPADRVIAQGLKARRYAGSKDRRAIRDLVYDAIRACGPVPASGRAAMLRLAQDTPELAALFDGSPYGPVPVGADEAAAEGGLAPRWLEDALAASDVAGSDAREALTGRSALDIRINRLKVPDGLPELPVAGDSVAVAPDALRYPPGTPVERWPAYEAGEIEVQDAGSQFVCKAVDARPGEAVIDLCAGAGGKTLALAAAMANKGVIVAADIDRARLSRLVPRTARAGVTIAQPVLLNPGAEQAMLSDWTGRADAVLIDAPCSGTGTLRRKPESRWRLSPERLRRFAETQNRLLDIAAGLVKPGGRLVFVTCSLLDEEGADRFAAFLARHDGYRAELPALGAGKRRGTGLRLTPFNDGTDGFFVARAVRSC